MAAGLRLRDAQGRLFVDTSTMIPKLFDVGAVTSDGSVTVLPIAYGESVGVPISIPASSNEPPPEVTLSGSTLSWRASGRPGNVSVVLV